MVHKGRQSKATCSVSYYLFPFLSTSLFISFIPSSLPSFPPYEGNSWKENEFEIRKYGHFLNKKLIALSTNVFFASCFVLLKYNFPRYYLI